MKNNEYIICQVLPGDQNPAVEEGLSILGQPPEELMWVSDPEMRPKFITGEQLGIPTVSGMWMLPVWTRTKAFMAKKE